MTATHVLCPLCGKTVLLNQDGRPRSHRGYIPRLATEGACKGAYRISTTGWPSLTDDQGRTVLHRPGDVPGREVSPQELMEAAFGPDFQVDTGALAFLGRRFDIRLKGGDQ